MSKEQRDKYIKRVKEIRRANRLNQITLFIFAMMILVPIILWLLEP